MKLRVKDRQGERQLWVQRRVSTLGASRECHLQLEAAGVEAVHALIYQEPDGFRLTAADAHCPLLVNEQPTASHAVRPGDIIGIGQAELLVISLADRAESTDTVSSSDFESPPLPEAMSPCSSGAEVAEALLLQLERFSESILTQAEWPRPAEILLDSLLQATGFEQGMLILFEEETPHIVASRPALETPSAIDVLLSDSILNEVLRTGQPLFVDNARQDPLFAAAPSIIELRLSSVVCVPLKRNDRLLGALYLGQRGAACLLTPHTRSLIQICAAQASLLLESARHVQALRSSVADLRQQLLHIAQEGLVAESQEMVGVIKTLERAAPTSITVLLLGETGTGKEVLARFLHQRSTRAEGPFVAVNCAALPAEILESELFGHLRGAFSGAHRDRPGLVEAAHQGTLFLDEVGELPPPLQAKLLRVLQEHTVRRLGDTADRPVDLRVIAATNRDIESEPTFRRDLFYRLAELVVNVPPLRQRQGDLDLLVHFFLHRYVSDLGRGPLQLSTEAWRRVRDHVWPGNIRELQNRVHRATLMAEGQEITPADLGFGPLAAVSSETLAQAKEKFVAHYVKQALIRSGGERSQAARELGIGLRSLYRYLQYDSDEEEP